MFYYLLVGLIVLASVLMCFVVMIQNSKGGGLASSFAASNQIMGVRKTTDFIEKLTWGLAIFMVVVSVFAAYALPGVSEDSESGCRRTKDKSVECTGRLCCSSAKCGRPRNCSCSR